MCFSAKASFVASGVLGVIGLATSYRGWGKKIDLLAIIPFCFAIQQASEGFVWLGINAGNPSHLTARFGAYIFLFFAYIFWPIITPTLLYCFEKNLRRKELLCYALFSGVVVAIIAMIGIFTGGIEYAAINHHIVYRLAHSIINGPVLNLVYGLGILLYACATIGALCISTIPLLWMFTVIVATGFLTSLVFYYLAFTSIWCFFAALASCTLYGIVARNS